MKIKAVKVAELKHPERNVRIHTEKQVKELQRSLEMFGQIRPVIVDENNVVLAGNGLVKALREMGTETVDIFRKEDLTENQKKKLMLADNKLYDLGWDDLDMLNQFIQEMKDDLDIPGFDEEILKSFVITEQDISIRVGEYGKLPEEEIMKRQAETPAADIQDGAGAQPETQPSGEEKAGRYIVCPHCQEDIWLP